MKCFFLLTLGILFPSLVFSQQPPIAKATSTQTKPTTPTNLSNVRIGVINTAAFAEGIEEYKKQLGKLEAEFQPRTKELEALKSKMDALEIEIKSQGENVKPELLKQKSDQYKSLEKELQRKGEDLQVDVNKRQETILGPLREKVYKFLETYCNLHGIGIVFDLATNGQTGMMVVVNSTVNITEDFMKEYNKTNPVAASIPK